MKRIIVLLTGLTLLFMLATVVGAADVVITVDGDAEDWASIEPAATATDQNAVRLKLYEDQDYLYILVEGSGLDTNSQIFLNTDGSTMTGYVLPQWGAGGFDYHLSNETPRRYIGTGGTNWVWETVEGANVVLYAKNDAVLEIGLLKSSLGDTAETISVGYVQRDADWQVLGAIPTLFPVNYALQ